MSEWLRLVRLKNGCATYSTVALRILGILRTGVGTLVHVRKIQRIKIYKYNTT